MAAGDLDNNSAMAKKINVLWSELQVREQVVVSSMAGHAVIVKRVVFEADSRRLSATRS
jgi:type IV pilus assembly protein PilM